MSYTLVGPSQYVDDRGKLFSKDEESYIPVKTAATEAEDRYVDRHIKGGSINAKN